ncbi:MAG: site-2 protease family protein [Burkholderiales bacterium]|nr:site-2 protease family protein [Burkholderiales bacterium]
MVVSASLVQTIAIYAIPVLLAITLHEAAHGYAARHFGDSTAAVMGRLSLNPLRHVDLFGTIAMPLLLYFMTSGNFVFGYAKPVPVDSRNLRRPKQDMLWVAFAGPASNLLMALMWALFAAFLAIAGVDETFFIGMAQAGVLVNFVMAALNLFPLPPLDGGRMLVAVLPYAQAVMLSRIENFGFFIVLALAATRLLEYWMVPLLAAFNFGLAVLLRPLIQFL